MRRSCLVLLFWVLADGFFAVVPRSSLRSRCSRTSLSAAGPTTPPLTPKNVGVIILAGGKGKRMKAAMPKQFLPLLGKPVFLRSLEVFQGMTGVVSSIVIVLDESYRDEFKDVVAADSRIRWADPGVERQDSVFSGLQHVPDACSVVAIHDAARPLVTVDEITRCVQDALVHGAAVLGVPMKATVKESADGAFVLRTVPRARLWEVHTPQVASKALFLRGFAKVRADSLEVTDDVSVIEALGLPVRLTLGEYTNIKLTTPDDLQVAEQILKERGVRDESQSGGQGQGQGQGPAGTECSSAAYRASLEGGGGADKQAAPRAFSPFKKVAEQRTVAAAAVAAVAAVAAPATVPPAAVPPAAAPAAKAVAAVPSPAAAAAVAPAPKRKFIGF